MRVAVLISRTMSLYNYYGRNSVQNSLTAIRPRTSNLRLAPDTVWQQQPHFTSSKSRSSLAILTGNYNGYICDDILHLRMTLFYLTRSSGFAFSVLVLKFWALGDEMDWLGEIEDGWLVQSKEVHASGFRLQCLRQRLGPRKL